LRNSAKLVRAEHGIQIIEATRRALLGELHDLIGPVAAIRKHNSVRRRPAIHLIGFKGKLLQLAHRVGQHIDADAERPDLQHRFKYSYFNSGLMYAS